MQFDQSTRRELITLLGGAAVAWPLRARAQQPERMRRIGVLMGWPESDSEAQAQIAAFRDGLQKLGWMEGRNILIETRWATPTDAAAMQRFAKELAALQPDVILASTTPTTTALLQQTRTIKEIAKRTAIPSRTAGIVAAAFVSLGLLEQDGGLYQNSAVTAAFLAGKAGHDLRPVLRFFNQHHYPLWEELADAVRTGEGGQALFRTSDEAQQKTYSAGVEAFTAPVAAALATTHDFSRHRRMLDVGGGKGSFLAAVLRQYPALRGTLFDLPGACAVASQRLAQAPERRRIDIVEGDVFKVSLPNDHDVVLVANVVHLLSVAHNLELLAKIRSAVQTGVQLLLVDFWTDPTHSEPMAAALMSGAFFLSGGEGQTHSEQEADEWLKQTKWRKLERKPLSGSNSLIVAEAI